MTDAEHKRVVEVMARAMWPSCAGPDPFPCEAGCSCDQEVICGITALLRIADVKMKDQADDR